MKHFFGTRFLVAYHCLLILFLLAPGSHASAQQSPAPTPTATVTYGLADTIFHNATYADYAHVMKMDVSQNYTFKTYRSKTDCSGFISYLLIETAKTEYDAVVDSARISGAGNWPTAEDYQAFFDQLETKPANGWQKIYSYKHLRQGDIIAWKSPKKTTGATGHIMMVIEPPGPVQQQDISGNQVSVVRVHVIDSTSDYHFDLQELPPNAGQKHRDGLGKGYIKLVVDASDNVIGYQEGYKTIAGCIVEGGDANGDVSKCIKNIDDWSRTTDVSFGRLTGTATGPAAPTNNLPQDGAQVDSLSFRLTSSPFSGSGAHTGTQWIIEDASGHVAFQTMAYDQATGAYFLAFSPVNLTQFNVPPGILSYDASYTWRVVYRDDQGSTGWSSFTGFKTPPKPANVDDFGVSVVVNQVTDKGGQKIDKIDGTNIAALRGDDSFQSMVPQIGAVASILGAGRVTDQSGNTVLINTGDIRLVKTGGGTGQAFSMVGDASSTFASIQPISSSGETLDASGTMVKVADFALPSGASLPYGLFNFTVNVTPGATAKVVIVPPQPFAPGTAWYKLDQANNAVVAYPLFEVDTLGNGILTLIDGGAGDSDYRPGVIRDPGGPGIIPAGSSISGGGGSGCFIATAAFGSCLHPFVEILRTFRDRVLLSCSPGSSFVSWYYRVSPPVADVIARNSVMKAGVRLMLLPAIGLAWLCLKVGVLQVLFMLLCFGSMIVMLIRRVT